MTDSELEELQLQVEGGICKLPISEMEQLAEHIGLESKEYKGKSKSRMSLEKQKTRLNILRNSRILLLGRRRHSKKSTKRPKTNRWK